MLLVDAHDLSLHALRVSLVAFLDFGELRLQSAHLHAGAHRLLVEWPEEKPYDDAEDNENPTVAEICVHPEKNAHDDCRKRLHDALEESPIGVRVLEVTAEGEQPTPFLRTCVQFETERTTVDRFEYYRRSTCGIPPSTRPTHNIDLGKGVSPSAVSRPTMKYLFFAAM